MKRLTLFLSAILCLGTTAPASAVDYSKIFVFGDSLVDSGNAQIGSLALGLPDPAPASAGYFNGRFSNGYNFADYLSLGYVGAAASPFLANQTMNTNFAVGGATAAETSPIIPGFIGQLGLFQGTAQPIPGDALVIVTFGGNDVRAQLGNLGIADFTATLTAFSNGLAALTGAGAKNILVTGLADVGAIPSVLALGNATVADLATARSQALNAQFAAIAQTTAQLSGADIDFFDLFALDRALHDDPAAFGMPGLNLTDSCQSGGAAAVLGGCTGYLYFDGIHPTTAIHALMARSMAAQLAVPETGTWLLMIVGLGVIGGGLRQRAPASRERERRV
ncbi:SGNH/GDSL hydrolase family protein [Sphingobium nicotianae]|uniref:SGNH/GDSL hydrolase family protein n=1 Tax=Sphingobium nicotianae TaxID=2782607 RepID=A0A9X1DCU3_9SPHN|nr:SGNH/GDSL hydrolase family protein [Sphingobium nicotianae]MBT2187673.1 SGNH/GDSL hydrolase family protein [Sphingobium nicotianae]